MPKLKFKKRARLQLERLSPTARADVDRAVLKLQANPTDVGVRLRGTLRGRWRMREGGYRIIYRVLENGRLVIVDAVIVRSEGYKKQA